MSSDGDVSFDDRDVRARVARWLDEYAHVAGSLRAARSLADRAEAAERRATWLDRQVAMLMDETRRLREERRDIAAAARTLVDFQKLNYVLERLSS